MHGLPENWKEVFASLAVFYHWTPQTIDDLTLEDLLWWYRRALELESARG